MLDDTAVLETPAIGTEGAETVSTEVPTEETVTTETESIGVDNVSRETSEQEPQKTEEKGEDLSEFTPHVSSRLRELTKKSPQLGAAMNSNPDVKNTLEATFRREAAYREIFPTVAEAREMREALPNGIQDLQSLQAEVNELAEIDKNFVTKDATGRFTGHTAIIQNMHQQDPVAFSALVKTGVQEWAKLDPDAYNHHFSQVLTSTLRQDGMLSFMDQIVERTASSDDAGLKKAIGDLVGYLKSFGQDTGGKELSPEAQRLKEREQALDVKEQNRIKQEGENFHRTFVAESVKLQKQIVAEHPLIKRLPQSIPVQKRERIIEEVRSRIKAHLNKNPTFMRNLTPAYNSMDLQKTLDIQKNAWKAQWLLNAYVRKVLAEETPGLTAKATVRTGAVARPAATMTGTKHTGPYREGKQLFHANGQKMTIQEALMSDL